MSTNLILRRLRYALNLRDSEVKAIFALADQPIELHVVAALMRPEDHPEFMECSHAQLEFFLDGLVIHFRGPRDTGPGAPPAPPKLRLTNNLILKKLRVALGLRDEDFVEILKAAGFPMSKAELNAVFRKPGSRQYKPCGNQLVRNFLMGLCRVKRPTDSAPQAPTRA